MADGALPGGLTADEAGRELAENANTYTPLGPGEERLATGRYVVWLGRVNHPSWTVAQRFRLQPSAVEAARDEIHAALRERGRTGCTWEVGSSATPPDLVERLLALGLVDDDEPLAVGMVLTEPPLHSKPEGVEVRRVTTAAEALEAARIAAVAFGMPEPVPAAVERDGRSARYLAYVDGEPVAQATAIFTGHGACLFGGATLPDARGRGAYRALVAARWEDAVARGTPLLVTQAGAQSRPILERLGFRGVCRIRILRDLIAP